MYHKQLVNHVTTKLKEGSSKEEIQEELTKDGWSKDDIREAFYYSAYPEKLRHFSLFRVLHSEVPTTVTIILILFALAIIAIPFFMFRNKILSYTINLPVSPQEKRIEFTYGEQPALSNPDFFSKVKQQFITDKANFVEADLSAMILRVYTGGAMTLEVPIVTKGREGSWWETPAGLYKINSKEKTHFSGMGHVWMPWSMNFQGNFYIHGRTYYPNGTLTSNQYTGGCIRLSTEDAEKVFNSIETGTPLLVFEHSFSPDNFTYEESSLPIDAPIYLAADLKNNHVFKTKDASKEVPIASLTKLVAALVTTEYINLDNIATVPKAAIVYTSKPRLQAGSEYSIYQLLFPLLMESSNEAAETIARYYGRDSFIKHMNEKAAAIGMLHSHFSDPSGADAQNTSTAEDLFMLTKYIYNNRSFIFNITSGKIKNSAYGSSGFSDLSNLNDFIDNEYFFGGKNGKTTAAAESNISVFEIPVGETKRPIVFIVLESPHEKQDAEKLIDYALNNFRK
jgi:hypothetical protein